MIHKLETLFADSLVLLLVQQQRHHVAVFRHDVEPCRQDFVCVHGEGGIAEVPQQDTAGQLAEVGGELAGVSAVLHEVRPGRRHVHDADVQAHCVPHLPRELLDHRDHGVAHRHRLPALRRADAPVRHPGAAQDAPECDLQIRRLYGAPRPPRRSRLTLVPSARLQLRRHRHRVRIMPAPSL